MPRITRSADVTWEGNLARGEGRISGATSGAFAGLPYSLPTRVGKPEGKTSPEELVAAAHAGCFAMSLAGELTGAGTPPGRLDVRSTCVVDEVDGRGHLVVGAELAVTARVEGVSAGEFRRLVEVAERGCTISALIRESGPVSVDARLEEED
jgi:osmotically inducible protein OsmC